ncbi:uncharacterized protein LOC142499860 isoform X1 [Ascaphus truei]|uniref:uncharacterized protein LOC142499860 isoform X1 n=1 Tax=Ascaphus truei TaxID=8439 RepID=UPI003F5A8117
MVWTLSIINTAPQGISFPPQHPVSNAPCPSAMTYISADETHEHSRVISSSQNNELCAKHGLKDMALGSMHPLKSIDSHAVGSDCHHAGNTASISTAENRLYRSLENLHWAAVSDSAVYTHYRSVDSDFTLHCRSTRHMSEGSAARAPVHSMAETCGHAGERIAVHKDLPVPPIAKGHHWLFPTADDKLLHGDAKRELKEKLRIHSSKVVEPNRPVRPPTFLPNCVAKESAKNKTCQHCKCVCRVPCSSAPALAKSIMPVTRQCTSILYNRTSPEQIKREAIRRLQLRRQNSSPNLTVHHAEKETRGMVKSKTTESFNEQRHCSGRVWAADTRRKLCSKGRLYIPTFEEFKRMRNREKGYLSKSDVCLDNMESTASKIPEPEWNTNTHLPMTMEIQNHTLGNETSVLVQGSSDESYGAGDLVDPGPSQSKLSLRDSVTCSRVPFIAQHGSLESRSHSASYCSTFPAPICSSPVPRFPLQTVTIHREKEEYVVCEPNLSIANRSSGFPNIAEQCLTSEAHSSCCPSLLLEATDLSGYGAKLQKMKDGLIGSALDLIKKSCSAETAAEPPARVSYDLPKTDTTSPEENNQSPAVSMATQSRQATPNTEDLTDTKPTGSPCSPGCRRSSSDMTHEAVDTGKTQRGCRLRPHFSDPMPTDAVKRKQLELKIAAAARHHAQRRRQDKGNGPVLTKAITTTSCRSGKEGGYTPGHSQRSRHRWSNMSSLSTDSGVVGMNDERDESEASGTEAAKPGEVERADSGIGDALSRKWRARVSEATASLEAWEAHRPCLDCGERDSAQDTESRGKRRETLCVKCVTRRTERKEAVLEFVNTEASYGEDLRIIKEEFYLPMQTAGLLAQEQLQVVFSNIQELIDLSEKFLEVLQEEIDQSLDQGDDDLMTVCIGEIFLEFVNMLPAFQTYCLQQSASVTMLNALEKEKELLRIFLDVSQNDNTALRRMNLRSFLIAPLQRVTKYPLLLSRILKSTTEFHLDHSSLWEAKSRIESHLEHINMKTKQEGNPWTLRTFRRESRKNREVTNIEMRETAIKQLGWAREETRFIMEGLLQMAQPTDGQWVKKGCKALRFQNVQALLMVNVRRASESSLEGSSAESSRVRDAALVLIKDKNNGKFGMLREPLKLGHCVVSTDPDCEGTFELLEIRREGFVFRDGDSSRTHHWFRQIKTYSRELGSWKKRRNALPNIMISTIQSRS